MKLRGSKALITKLAKFRHIDTALFEHDEEWQILDALLFAGMDDVTLARLEDLASKVSSEPSR